VVTTDFQTGVKAGVRSGGALRYRPDIDGLRAVAVVLVVLYHAFPSRLPGGFIGVDVFFVISGFLITHVILDDAAAGRFTFTDFYVRRCRRIFPALGVILLGTWILGFGTLVASEFANLGKHVAAGSLFSANILLWTETGYFDGPAVFKPLLHLWSLGVEEQYYLIWPILLLVLLKRKRVAPFALAALLAASLALCVATTTAHPSAAFYLLPARFWELLTGAGLAFADRDRTGEPRFAGVWAALGLLSILVAAMRYGAATPYPGAAAVAPVFGTAALIYAGSRAWINRTLLSLKPVVGVGLISYPLYLWHWPLLSIFSVIGDELHQSPAVTKLVRGGLVGVAFVLAFLTYRFVERPVQARVKRYSTDTAAKRRAIVVLAGALASIAVLGAATTAAGGLVFRHRVLDPAHYAEHDDEISLQFFDADLARFPHCDGTYRQLPSTEWCYQSSAAKPDIALVGDSHARALFPGLADAVEHAGIGHVLLAARCAPLMNVNIADEPACLETNRDTVKLLAADPSIRTVVLTSRGPLYLSGTGYGTVEAGIGKALQSAEGVPGPARDLFASGYIDMARALQSAGKRVAVVIDVPELGFAPSDCVYARPFQGKHALLREPCAVRRNAVRARQAEYRSVLSDVMGADRAIGAFDTANVLCDADNCYAEHDGRFLYTDANHLGVFGSRLVGNALADFLFRDMGTGAHVS
jgi:peptidoglycan/LPS O-acetylase OafA/YrhL